MRWRDDWQARPPIFRSRFHKLSTEYNLRKREALVRRLQSTFRRIRNASKFFQQSTSAQSALTRAKLAQICESIIDQYADVHEPVSAIPRSVASLNKQLRPPPWKRLLRSKCQPGRVLATSTPTTCQSWDRVKKVWSAAFPQLVSGISGGVYTSSNTVKIYDNGEACFRDILRAIDKAQGRVWLESYCIDQSAVGQLLCDHLVRAARRGVDVVVSVDAVGSFGVPLSLRKDLREAGGNLVIFNPIWRAIGPLVYRNHRKILVADAIGFCGSMNFDWRSARAAGVPAPIKRQPRRGLGWLFQRVFRDLSATRPADYNQHVGCVGPVVKDLAHSFCRKLDQSRLPLRRDADTSGSEVGPRDFFEGDKDVIHDVLAQVVENDGKDCLDYTQAVVKMLSSATHSVVVASSYFHPPGNIRRALGRAFRRGVASVLLLSGLSDVPFDSQASLAILPYFLVGKQNMCRAFFLKRAHCHTKTLTVDNFVSLVGSFNLDRYSARRNCEIGLAMYDPRVARVINKKIEGQIVDAAGPATEEYELQKARDMTLIKRIVSLASYHFVRASGCALLDGFRTDEVQNRLVHLTRPLQKPPV